MVPERAGSVAGTDPRTAGELADYALSKLPERVRPQAGVYALRDRPWGPPPVSVG
jgi:hypothetical protein